MKRSSLGSVLAYLSYSNRFTRLSGISSRLTLHSTSSESTTIGLVSSPERLSRLPHSDNLHVCRRACTLRCCTCCHRPRVLHRNSDSWHRLRPPVPRHRRRISTTGNEENKRAQEFELEHESSVLATCSSRLGLMNET